MKSFPFLLLLIPMVYPAHNQTDSDLPVEVIRFSWSKTRTADTHPNRPATDQNRTGSANPARREFDYLRETANRSSVEERSRAMKELEEKTAQESRPPHSLELYQYRIELKNRGSNTIKWAFVDYQTSAASDPDNPSHRQFACSVTIKSNQSKLMEAFSNLPPNRIVSAVEPDKPRIERVIINRIEYADGAVWQRPNWQAPENIPTGPKRGQCRPI